MIELLAKFFIKDNKNYKDAKVRKKYGELCGGFGIFLNILLFVSKFVFGTIAASVAMVADAFNNLSDAASSVVQLLGFKLAAKEPDTEHPFGHGRFEYISGLFISFLILYMGFELIKSSVESLFHPEPVNCNIYSILVLCIAILIKFYMYLYNHRIGKKIDSVSMEATAKDSFGDVISTSVVIISVIASKFTTFPVDGIAGVIVGFFILKTGYESAKETIEPLLGAAPSREFVQQIEKEVLKHKLVIGIHDLIIHDYGPGRKMISLHAEVSGEQNIFEVHDEIDRIEVEISQKFNCHVVIHMDPIDDKNVQLGEYKSFIQEQLTTISPEMKAHDVRMVPGPTHTNLIFDIIKPFDCNLKDEELKRKIQSLISEKYPTVFCVITIDIPFV